MPRPTAGELVIDVFRDRYEEELGTQYLVNYGMIVAAGRMAKFYSMPQIHKAMDAFFKSNRKKDFYNFINNIDSLYEEAGKTDKYKQDFEKLEKTTTKKVKSIHKKRVGKKT